MTPSSPGLEAADALVARVRDGLRAAADPTRAEGVRAYLKSALPCLGVPMPVLRRLIRDAVDAAPMTERAAFEHTVRRLWDEVEYREEWHAALAVAGHRHHRVHQDAATLPFYRHLVTSGAWWDVVDDIATHRVRAVLVADRAAVTPVVRAWAGDDDLWVRRTSLLCQVGLRAETDVALLDHVLSANLDGSRHGREFFVRKAVGWALRDYARTEPDWVRAWVDAHAPSMAGLSVREATKHL